jgi:C-terminal domain 7 of the ABC-three component (ABC-3C) systems
MIALRTSLVGDGQVSSPPKRRSKLANARAQQIGLRDATDAYLGYVYQSHYALLTLLSANDDESVAMETFDDFVLEGKIETLHQLKHSLRSARPLTITDERWWRTLAIWIPHYRMSPGRYVLVTCAPVLFGDPLEALTDARDRIGIRDALLTEVERVRGARTKAEARGKTPPHARRFESIIAFSKLAPARQLDILERISIHPRALSIAEIPERIAAMLAPVTLPEVRGRVVGRLIEWWDRQVLLALLNERTRSIHKAEVQEHLFSLIEQHGSRSLPDDFSDREPPPEELEWGGGLVDQMQFVGAGEARIIRGLTAHWRATRQRERWLSDDVSVRGELTDFDNRLRRTWRDLHGPMVDDTANATEMEKRKAGLHLLDWSHSKAFQEIRPLRPDAPHDFVTQGSYQLLASVGDVGWHPAFAKLLRVRRKERKAS